MKVNIITCHTPYNYGAVLQCYALNEYIKSQGNSVSTIDYVTPKLQQKNVIFGIVRKIVRFVDFKRCKKIYGDFLKKYIALSPIRYANYKQLEKNPPKADATIVGSDQVWNFELKNAFDESFYLSFVPNSSKKIAYAASIAMEQLPKDKVEFFKERVSSFDFVSVREMSAVKILNKIGISNVSCVLDPIYLLSKEQWTEFADTISLGKRYVLIYVFNRKKEYYNYALRLAEKRGLKVYIISNLISDKRFKHDKFFWVPTPQKFIALIKNADAVITNSFHGLSFSILFSKDVHVFNSVSGTIRILDALSQFGLTSRLIPAKFDGILNDPINYQYAQKVVSEMKVISTEFLQNALG